MPDASGPSPRHSQQLGQSAAVPSGLMASVEFVLCSLDDDDNTVLLVDDVAMERSHGVVECSQEEMVGRGSVIFPLHSESQMSADADAYKSGERNGSGKLVLHRWL